MAERSLQGPGEPAAAGATRIHGVPRKAPLAGEPPGTIQSARDSEALKLSTRPPASSHCPSHLTSAQLFALEPLRKCDFKDLARILERTAAFQLLSSQRK
jgi:hypothetical protein